MAVPGGSESAAINSSGIAGRAACLPFSSFEVCFIFSLTFSADDVEAAKDSLRLAVVEDDDGGIGVAMLEYGGSVPVPRFEGSVGDDGMSYLISLKSVARLCPPNIEGLPFRVVVVAPPRPVLELGVLLLLMSLKVRGGVTLVENAPVSYMRVLLLDG